MDCSNLDYNFDKNCGGACSLHRYFCLIVTEQHNCASFEFDEFWEKDTICQYFHMDYIFGDLDIGKSEYLASHPPFLFGLDESPENLQKLSSITSLENLKIESNFELYLNQLPNYIKKTFKIEENSYCLNKMCSGNPQNIKIKLENPPYFYMLQLDSSESSHLTSFLSTLSIKPVIELSEIYDISPYYSYSLTRIIFKLNNINIFANFDSENWTIEGYSNQSELNFKKFLEIVVLMKLQPYIIVYCRGENKNNEESFRLFRKDLLRLEQIAVQADWSFRERGTLVGSFDEVDETINGFKIEDEFNESFWKISSEPIIENSRVENR